VVAGVAAVVLVGVLGVRAVLVRALCEQSPVRLHVSAADDIAPAVMRIGQRFNGLGRDVGGHCAQVEVTEDPASAVAAQLSGTGTIRGEGPVDAWVPDSTVWPDVVGSSPRGAAAVRWTGISVARSPLVIAAPPKVAGLLMRWSRHLDWPALFPASLGGPPPSLGLQIQFPDPVQSGVGLATSVEVRRLLGGRQAARARFTAFAHNVQLTTALQDPQDLAAFTALSLPPWDGHPVTVTTEQAVEAYDHASPRVPLTAFSGAGVRPGLSLRRDHLRAAEAAGGPAVRAGAQVQSRRRLRPRRRLPLARRRHGPGSGRDRWAPAAGRRARGA
jgi:hypothetical protein